ncbi:hypothetical protein K470DRAFT_260147 [Piedraia hortae CBS 480.64]|uniref:Uncharacterized protein n=1 Tax=Piedraia hortae CBS 480.64 TaxID=1314780 RepID=A0A6A7BS10_9PEZI|nr:hypothetical protein K470DRAFT_260147 [Piedraia hortae CBS 480.64]
MVLDDVMRAAAPAAPTSQQAGRAGPMDGSSRPRVTPPTTPKGEILAVSKTRSGNDAGHEINECIGAQPMNFATSPSSLFTSPSQLPRRPRPSQSPPSSPRTKQRLLPLRRQTLPLFDNASGVRSGRSHHVSTESESNPCAPTRLSRKSVAERSSSQDAATAAANRKRDTDDGNLESGKRRRVIEKSSPARIRGPLPALFFSNNPFLRPVLPPRFSSAEAAARMLSKAQLEDGLVKTVSLPRGTVSTTLEGKQSSRSPTPAMTVARRWSERSSASRSSTINSMASSRDPMASIGAVELLDQDERPVFAVDLADHANYGPGPLRLAYVNPALNAVTGLAQDISGESQGSPDMFLQFKCWLLGVNLTGEAISAPLPKMDFMGMTWNFVTLKKRMRIVSGSPSVTTMVASETCSPTPANPIKTRAMVQSSDYFGRTSSPPLNRSEDSPVFSYTARISSLPATPSVLLSPRLESDSEDAIYTGSALPSPTLSPFFDWTRLPVDDKMPAHVRFARSVDWANTSLGPIETWDSDLREMCNLIMASPYPAALYWGDDNVVLYNEAYVPLAGKKHPWLMGQTYSNAWSEIWDDIEEVFALAKATGKATMKDDDCLFMKRSNFLEETYFSWSIIPVVGHDGSVKGLFNPAFEKTRRAVAERRMLTLREVGERTAPVQDVKSFWRQVLVSFNYNEYDSPFVLLYSVTDEADSDSGSMYSGSLVGARQCLLEGSLGVPEGHQAAPLQIDLMNGTEGFGLVFREALKSDRAIVLEAGSPEVPASLLDGIKCRGFGDPVRYVVACPIHPTTGEAILGFLVLGVNPRRPYDDDYALFVQLLRRQLATSLASVVLFEEEIRRGQRAAQLAALERIELSKQLDQRTKEAMESEDKFTRMAELAPVGMCIVNSSGSITFANDMWYDISGVARSKVYTADMWIESVKDDDRELVRRLWKELVENRAPVSKEFRFSAQWTDASGVSGDTWALFSAFPETYEDGTLKSAFGSLTNITLQKRAEEYQASQRQKAVEMKRQQENFIDITSHEMRNPLSAILQCADEIINILTRCRNEGKGVGEEVITSCLDAAQIINLCAQHQKRIVDDILTLSKLDSRLLLVTPVDTQPLMVVQRALKMHESEIQAADIQMKLVVDKSYQDLGLDWVRLDPSRMLQVLINLTTNAIKFTGSEKRRTITVTLGASLTTPESQAVGAVKVHYIARREGRQEPEPSDDWGTGERVFIHITVQDSGRGLDDHEKKILFQRFSQASPRTHVQYGGSGLGLFISRELTELQGGQIGVESEAGKGSTFAFYVQARRSTAPADVVDKTTLEVVARSPKARKKRETQGPHKVLVVEDNLVNQRVLQKQLKNLGTEVHLANHGGEALEKLKQSTYWTGDADQKPKLEVEIILMDQEMPVMDGLTCTKKIRELERQGLLRGHVPIIAVTANARAEQIQTALDAGMDDVVSKPFRIPELAEKIEELMAKYPAP